jgi:predicted kinase
MRRPSAARETLGLRPDAGSSGSERSERGNQSGIGSKRYCGLRTAANPAIIAVMPTLIVFSGLPGTGKTMIARELARELGAVYLRIDSIEQAIRASGMLDRPIDDAGYRVAYVLAEDNLRMGRTVVADCVNPLQITRDAWIGTADRAQARAVEVEVICSDPQHHRQRVDNRISDISGLELPTWDEVISREYEPWQRKHVVIDTARRTVSDTLNELLEFLANQG